MQIISSEKEQEKKIFQQKKENKIVQTKEFKLLKYKKGNERTKNRKEKSGKNLKKRKFNI